MKEPRNAKTNEWKVWNTSQIWSARSSVYRSRCLQVNTPLATCLSCYKDFNTFVLELNICTARSHSRAFVRPDTQKWVLAMSKEIGMYNTIAPRHGRSAIFHDNTTHPSTNATCSQRYQLAVANARTRQEGWLLHMFDNPCFVVVKTIFLNYVLNRFESFE